ncbi:UDP-N-acetylmuramate--L-alanine ligase [Dissulfurispira thermophila]|uniref:UDP-N-acetylmuramate--L-alanine ligase n=2 Tax=root TaxID=1 RepID=A0A7G1H0Q7_9BACT|nr:UDP-N-acetylmuramate--L-alanine ligase [Dissulfurispira thermophila]BCB95859.1 UDP-N-acetylmuramate--L-alanine ligase [Dissulfurispira thermophila]
MFNKYRIIHFVGIGGIGMSGIAEVLYNLGYEVTGSDIKESEVTSRLRNLGIKIFIGHDSKNINSAHVVVISSAVSTDNPEVLEAKQRSIPVIPRAEMLAELGRLRYGILVAGAHGKTTTTSLVATILNEGGLDPTVIIGGKLKSMGSNAKLGQGDYIVAEADESDGSFLKLNPTIAVITNIDREHMDYFKDIDLLKHAFLSFINKIPFYGIAVVCIENGYIREIIPLIQRKYLTYGLSEGSDIYARNIQSLGMRIGFEAVYKGKPLGMFNIPLPGKHNVLNSLAAIAVAMELQIPLDVIARALNNFSGIQRRFEFKGEVNGIKIFDDYGHHPSEIMATLRAARECFNDSRLFVLFQPHRYTRTRDLMNEFITSFTSCLNSSDRLFLMDIYSAGEKPIEGVSSKVLAKKIQYAGFKNLSYIPDRREILEKVASELKQGDVLITLGAGDVYKIGEEVLKKTNLG